MERNYDELYFLDEMSTDELLGKLEEVEAGLFERNLVRQGIMKRLGRESEV